MNIHTVYRHLSADTYTPVSLYLKLRDHFNMPVLLESSDYHATENSFSFLCFEPLLKFSVTEERQIEYFVDGNLRISEPYRNRQQLSKHLQQIMQEVVVEPQMFSFPYAGFFGYTAYDAIPLFENIQFHAASAQNIPPMLYAFYKIVVVINHFKDEMYVFSHDLDATLAANRLQKVLDLMNNHSFSTFSFQTIGSEKSNFTDQQFQQNVKTAQKHIARGDIFQVVLSRQFNQAFQGDEFNVYRALRSINPSPYLFYFDFGNFKLFGSSPEAQLIVKKQQAEIHPIAGTIRRTGDDTLDLQRAQQLLDDPKENAEHNMLVDLARNDLSRHCQNVKVTKLKEIQFYSHVIHLVSKVTGTLKPNTFTYDVFADSFPAGTLSGAPKHRAMQIIDQLEQQKRGYYGGAIGFWGLNGDINHAIMIRTFLSHQNHLYYQAGAGVVNSSIPENENKEVHNKIGALRKAIEKADPNKQHA